MMRSTHNFSRTVPTLALSVVLLSACGNNEIVSTGATGPELTTSQLRDSAGQNGTAATGNAQADSAQVAAGDVNAKAANEQGANATKEPIDLASLTMTVYKSPTCGCCSGWVDYMQAEGFAVNSVDTDDVDSIKTKYGLTSPELKSCHTAIVDGYVIEGHVPANDVKRLLTERPSIVGLTAPGMPMMSPGMSSRIPKDYDVLAVDDRGRTRVWSAY